MITFGTWTQLPGSFTTKLNSAVCGGPYWLSQEGYAGYKATLFAVGTDERIYFNPTKDYKTWVGWKEVPGNGRTNVGLAAVTARFGPESNADTLLLFARGVDERIYINSTTELTSWTGWKSVQGVTNTALCAVSIPWMVYLFAIGAGDSRIGVNATANGTSWMGWQGVPGIESKMAVATWLTSNGPPADLFVYSVSEQDNRIYYSSAPLNYVNNQLQWRTWTELAGVGHTPVSPIVISIFEPYPSYFVVGYDHQIYYQENNSSPWEKMGGETDTALAWVPDWDDSQAVYLFCKGVNDGRLYINRAAQT